MRRHRSFAVTSVLVVVVLLIAVQTAAASPVCESSLPFNIDAGVLEPLAIALLHQSTTFQQQCFRIAETTVLRVRVRVGTPVHSGRGETTISRYDTGALRAEIFVRFGDDYVELLAHEFEHVLEQVDHVNLSGEVSAHRAWLTPAGAFETDRARDAGVRVRQECDALAAEAVEARRRPSPHLRHPFD